MNKNSKIAVAVAGVTALVGGLLLTKKTSAQNDIEVDLYDLAVAPLSLYVEEPFEISVSCLNLSDWPGSYEVVCNILKNSSPVFTIKKNISLGVGEEKLVSFDWATTNPGSYEIEIGGLKVSVMVSAIPGGAEFVLSGLDVTPTLAYEGDNVVVKVAVTNIGQSAGSYEVICNVEEVL